MYRTRPAFFSSFRAASTSGGPAAVTHARSTLDALVLASIESIWVLTPAGPAQGPGRKAVVDKKNLFATPSSLAARVWDCWLAALTRVASKYLPPWSATAFTPSLSGA